MSGARAGVVYLVGGGPGDPGLMTRRSLDLIASADVILHDRLIAATALDGARAEAELIYVGKAAGDHAVEQSKIGELLIDRARGGRSVVRLKGGDPFVFGRGGEEAEELRAAGVEFEVVPGVSSGIAAPAYAGIPLTHRDAASSVAFVTGHEDPTRPEQALDYGVLARFEGTLVFYMGLGRLAAIATALISAGRDPDQPAAAIERGTSPRQRVFTAPLGELASAVEAARLAPPTLLVVGSVVAYREQIEWFERRPLHGVSIVVTRARAQASATTAALAALGAEVLEAPAIRIRPAIEDGAIAAAIERLADYDTLLLTSVNAVRCLFDLLAARGLDARSLAGLEVCVIGPGTARALAAHGITAELVAPRSITDSLLEILAERDLNGRRFLLARAAVGSDTLPSGLRERGAEVDLLPLYETVCEPLEAAVRAAAAAADYLSFTSGSTVESFLDAGGVVGPGTRVVTIGPVTSARAAQRGLRVDVEAERHDPDGLVAAIVADRQAVG